MENNKDKVNEYFKHVKNTKTLGEIWGVESCQKLRKRAIELDKKLEEEEKKDSEIDEDS